MHERYNSYFFCVSVCPAQTDLEDGFVLTPQMGIK